MAKRFGGFTPEQMGKIIPEMQGMQADEQAAYLASQPGAAARVGKMAEVAQQRIGMTYSDAVEQRGFAEGGTVLSSAQQTLADAQNKLQAAINAQQANPSDQSLVTAVTNAQTNVANAQQKLNSAYATFKTTEVPTSAQITSSAYKAPETLASTADVASVSEADKAAGEIATGTGQVTTPAPQAAVTAAPTAEAATAAAPKEAATYEPLSVEATTQDVLDRLEAATGKPSAEALVDAQTMSPQDLAQLGLSATQLAEAQRVQTTAPRVAQAGEMIEGATVDMERVRTETNFAAATGAPSTDATVQGQLTSLMEQFEGNEPPAWAAGAMRAATATMAARGLGASSMAGQAIVQAAMEASMPIAVQDAQTAAQFELTNLSNRQQTAMFAAEKRAEFLGLEFNQNFQTRVANAAKISEIANINFTAEQQVALENARMAQSVDLANLSASNAKVMADAAAMTQMDLTNLNNRQQSQVQNAKSFLDMDMTNLANTQQAAIFKTQSMTNALLSDQSAANAAKQFNASSENQTEQFFSNLASQVSMFNNEQANAMNQFNAGETNAISQFNTAQRVAREQFNANNGLIVAQANAAWSQAIATSETAAINQANRDAAVAENEFTMTAYNNVVQEERDLISYAFSASESVAERAVRLQIAAIQAETSEEQLQAQIDMAKGEGTGALVSLFADKALDWAFSKF